MIPGVLVRPANLDAPAAFGEQAQDNLRRQPPGIGPHLGLIDRRGRQALSPPERVVDQVSLGLVSRDKLR